MDPADIRLYILIYYWLLNSSLIPFQLINQQLTRSFAFIFLQYMQLMNSTIASLYAEEFDLWDSRNPRAIWMILRSEAIWLEMWNNWTDQQWIATYRMTKTVFLTNICNPIRHKLEPLPNPLCPRFPITPEKQTAMVIYYLASCCEYRVVGDIFGDHKTSVWRCMHRVVDAINEVLLPQWITMPNEVECAAIAEAYEAKCNIPQIIGAIDGCHIAITPPKDGFRDYINRKGWPSVVLQAFVDNNYLFRNINVQAPGSCHDAAFLRESILFRLHDQVIPQVTRELRIPQRHGDDRRLNVPYFIIGDPAYPLLSWLMKRYSERETVSANEQLFNQKLSMSRVDVEIAFGRLKARWRVVLKRIEMHHTFASDVIATCCVLHNIVESNRIPVNPFLITQAENADNECPQPDAIINREVESLIGTNMRNFLRDYLNR